MKAGVAARPDFGPRLYRGLQRVLAPGAGPALRAQLAALLGDWRPLGPALDLGCGDASLLVDMGLAPVLGLDVARDRLCVFAATVARPESVGAKPAWRGAAVCADATRLPLSDATVELAFCCGLLHHLPDAAAGTAVSEMARVVRPGGRLIVLDAVRPVRGLRRPLAAALRALDRGRWMRTQAELEALLRQAEPGLMWAFERVTYSATGLEGLWCNTVAPPTRAL